MDVGRNGVCTLLSPLILMEFQRCSVMNPRFKAWTGAESTALNYLSGILLFWQQTNLCDYQRQLQARWNRRNWLHFRFQKLLCWGRKHMLSYTLASIQARPILVFISLADLHSLFHLFKRHAGLQPHFKSPCQSLCLLYPTLATWPSGLSHLLYCPNWALKYLFSPS